MKIYIFRVWLV